MAVGHYDFNPQAPHGALLKAALTELESGRDKLADVVAALIAMKDGSNLTAYAVGKFGFPDTTVATAALAELESANGAVVGIAATLDQAFAKFRAG